MNRASRKKPALLERVARTIALAAAHIGRGTLGVALTASAVSLVFQIADRISPNPFDPAIQAAIALYVIRRLLSTP